MAESGGVVFIHAVKQPVVGAHGKGQQFTGNVIKRKGRGTVILFQKEPDPSKGVHHGAPPNRFFPRGAFQIRLKQR